MKIQFAAFIFALTLTVGCSTHAEEPLPEKVSASKDVAVVGPTPVPISISIKDSKGLIVLNEKYGKDDTIRIFNDDGSLWYEFTYYYEDRGGKFNEKSDFAPFSFHPDYFTLGLICVGEDKDRYEVVVNNELGIRKFVKKDDRSLELQTWEQHVSEAFAVRFDFGTNPVYAEPSKAAKRLSLPADDTFHPVQVTGEWLKIRWADESTTGSGWIKWRENDRLLIELYYFA